jgi:hypothetical protein
MYETTYDGGGWFADMGAGVWIFWLAVYCLWAFAQFKIARKTGYDSIAWMAFVPVLNLVQWPILAGKQWYWFLLYLVPVVNLVFYVWNSIDVAKNCRQSPVWGVLMLFPFLNLVAIGYLGFTSMPKDSMFPSDKPKHRQPANVG